MMKIIVLLFMFCWVGCTQSGNPVIVLDEHNVTELSHAEEWNRFIRSWEAVPLQLDSVSDFEVQGLSIHGDWVVVRGLRARAEQILLFDIRGNFMRQIGSQGNGEDQYGMVGFVRVDPLEQEISVYDGLWGKRYVTYGFDGSFKEHGNCKAYMHFMRQVYSLDSTHYIGYFACNQGNLCYFVSDKRFTKFDTVRPHYVRFPMGVVDFSVHPIAMYDGRISLVAPLCDTIFEYDGNGLKPRFVTKVHRSVTDSFQFGNKDYMTCLMNLKRKHNCYAKDEIYETKNWFIITYETGKLLYDKCVGQAYFMPKDISLRGDLIFPNDLWGMSEERLVAAYTAEELLAMRDKMQQAGVVLSDKVQHIFEQAEIEQQPVMIFYTLK